jgi:hypothetical protein
MLAPQELRQPAACDLHIGPGHAPGFEKIIYAQLFDSLQKKRRHGEFTPLEPFAQE